MPFSSLMKDKISIFDEQGNLVASDQAASVQSGKILTNFIENRPFKETNVMQKDEILAIILRNVNAKFVSTMKKQYTFKNIEQLVKFHDNIIAGFTKRYFEKYKDLPLEDIQGWDRMLLVAKNIQDEDLKDVYADMVSPEIIQKYSNIRPTTQENGLATNES